MYYYTDTVHILSLVGSSHRKYNRFPTRNFFSAICADSRVRWSLGSSWELVLVPLERRGFRVGPCYDPSPERWEDFARCVLALRLLATTSLMTMEDPTELSQQHANRNIQIKTLLLFENRTLL